MTSASDKTVLNPEKTPLFIGSGVVVNGAIHHTGDKGDRAVILGELRGDVDWNGVVQVTQGGVISAAGKISCRELVVAGKIHGDGVVIEAGVLRLEPTGDVRVENVVLPPGGLEQSRGSFFTGRLTMSPDHPYADEPEIAQSATRQQAILNVSALPAAASFTPIFSQQAQQAGPQERGPLDDA